MKLAVAALAALPTLAVAIVTPDQGNSGLAVQLKLVGNTEIKALVTNTGKDDLRLFKTNTLLSKAPVEKVHVTYNNNSRVPFVGAWVSVTKDHLDDSAFETLAAGQTVESVFDLARMFDLSQGGEYVVQANDSMPVADARHNLIASIPYTSNMLQVHVDGVKAARSRIQAYAAPSMAKRLQTPTCTGTRRVVVRMAKVLCRQLAYLAEYKVNQGPADRMQEFFKRSDQQTRDTVAKVFGEVSKVCASMTDGPASVSCDDVHNECNIDTIAITYPSQSQIVLCDPFFYFVPSTVAVCNSVDRGAVLVREATRLTEVKGTTGGGYDYDSLANNSAEVNLNNSDAYMFFAKSFDEPCYDNKLNPGTFTLFVCKEPRRDGNLNLIGTFNVPPDFDHQIGYIMGPIDEDCLAFDKPNCEGQNLKIDRIPWLNETVLAADWVKRISSFRCVK